ncbi:MAG: hypothetical protein A2Y88_09365 [Chloroflexi bacterium RBG_13_48_10]|nr:MAG: hypothetical protein A2Y88_09365 [Chloroflexi bacterium RBG_13_48_10]
MKKKEMNVEKLKPRWSHVAVVVLILSVILAACSPSATPEATTVPPTAVPPTAVPPTAVPPTAVPPTEVPPTPVPDPAYYEGEPVAVVPAGVPGEPMVTAAYNTAIFGGPGTNYVVYGAFLGSATAVAVGVSTDSLWYAISVPVAPDGNGWVSATYVLPQDTGGLPVLASPPVPPTVELVPPAEGDPQATALTQTYVRTGPADTYPAYGIAQPGMAARVIGKSEDGQWLVVRLNPQYVGVGYGWSALAYLEVSNIESVPVVAAPQPAPPVTSEPPPAGSTTATAVDYVNLRSGPGEEYLIIGTAAPGATGEVTGKSEDGLWWQVKVPTSYYYEGFAWVSVDWVYSANTENVPVVAAPPPPAEELPSTCYARGCHRGLLWAFARIQPKRTRKGKRGGNPLESPA